MAVLLRKCKILAARLDHPALADWVEHELNGYPSDRLDLFPEYRVLRDLEARGNFVGGTRWVTSHLIPKECIEPGDREALFNGYLADGVAVYDAAVTDDGDKHFKMPWPSAAVVKYDHRVLQGMTCSEAWRAFPRTAIDGLLDAVRNRVLSLALEIERENPEAGEAAIGSSPVSQDRLDRVFINILGGTNIIAAGAIGTITLPGGTWDSLSSELAERGVPSSEIDALGTALVADRKAIGGNELGPATKSWIGGITSKIEVGSLEVAANAGGGVIAGLVLKYLGLA